MFKGVQGADAAHGAGSDLHRVRAGIPTEAGRANGLLQIMCNEGADAEGLTRSGIMLEGRLSSSGH